MQNDPMASVERPEVCILVPSNGQALMTPPPPPLGYEVISTILAVALADVLGYWACLAYQQKQGVYGLLIYWQRSDIHTFYPTEDARHLLLLCGADWGLDLSGNCIQGEPSQDQLELRRSCQSEHDVFCHTRKEEDYAME